MHRMFRITNSPRVAMATHPGSWAGLAEPVDLATSRSSAAAYLVALFPSFPNGCHRDRKHALTSDGCFRRAPEPADPLNCLVSVADPERSEYRIPQDRYAGPRRIAPEHNDRVSPEYPRATGISSPYSCPHSSSQCIRPACPEGALAQNRVYSHKTKRRFHGL